MLEEFPTSFEELLKLEPKAFLQDREVEPDDRRLSGPRFAAVVDKGFQAVFILGEGDTFEEACQKAVANYVRYEPRKPSYEELETTMQTREHIDLIRTFLREFAVELLKRGETHDRSKLDRAEVDMFTEYTGRLKGMTYSTDPDSEYMQCLKEMGPALDHHYAHNRHHPEHFEKKLEGMTLIDLLEMFVDWKASVRRHANGDLRRSIDQNKGRFGMSDQLVAIFENTRVKYG